MAQVLSTLLILTALAIWVVGGRYLVATHYSKRGKRPPPFIGPVRMLLKMDAREWLFLALLGCAGMALIYVSGLVGNEA